MWKEQSFCEDVCDKRLEKNTSVNNIENDIDVDMLHIGTILHINSDTTVE